jgi:very-short-patch-repair endonuclease
MKRKIIPYNPHLKEFARQLRNNSTKSEIRLWFYLKNDKMMGYDFHRQKPIGNYICDFFCIELMLAIEVDGLSHEFEEVYKKDLEKDAFLSSLGIAVLRFSDNDVLNNIDSVIKAIEDRIYVLTHPQPLQGGE